MIMHVGTWCDNCRSSAHSLTHCPHTRLLNARVVIVGGGPTAADLGKALRALDVTVCDIMPVPLAHPKAPRPTNQFDQYKLSKAEAKRARKAQIKRNGGKP